MSAISIPPNHVTYVYVYKGENMKIGKDDDAAAAALRSRHTAIVQAVGPCLGARTFRRQLKRRLRGAMCTTPNTIIIHIRLRTVYTRRRRRRSSFNNYYYIKLVQLYKYLLPKILFGSSSFRFPTMRAVKRPNERNNIINNNNNNNNNNIICTY